MNRVKRTLPYVTLAVLLFALFHSREVVAYLFPTPGSAIRVQAWCSSPGASGTRP